MIQGSAAVTCVALGTMIGVLVGLGGFVLVPVLVETPDPWLRWGILFWYPTMGAAIGALVRSEAPARVPRWATGALVGAWANFVLTFFAHGQMQRFLVAVLGADSAFTSPFWFVLEGFVVGALIGLAVDRFGAEGEPIEPD
ncbi:MAG TPA: hypothetical protein VMM55_06730 [Thermohalobaculum sp.]|nr:hypothetical protein [Thermohalobaculum sp.]